MPKFTYSASKGIEQSSGSGFIIQDVPISYSSTTATLDATGSVLSGAEELCVVTTANATGDILALTDGTSVGQRKIVISDGAANTNQINIKAANGSDNIATGALQYATVSGVPVVKQFVWNGSAWNLIG